MGKRIAWGAGLSLVLLALGAWVGLNYFISGATADPAFFEDAILAFEAADRAEFPPPGGIVFVGSSSIRF
jgi:hypothetical protein